MRENYLLISREVYIKYTYAEHSLIINSNYSNNLVEMRKTEKEMKEIENKKDRYKMMIAVVLISTIIIVLYFYTKGRKLKKISRIDGLTQIYNRKYFNEVFEKLSSGEENFNIIIFDIDNFKHINDTYVHVF